MKQPFRITPATLDVMEVLLHARDGTYGYAIMLETGRPTGSVYPILARLEFSELLTAAWQTGDPVAGRPPKKLYTLTPKGRAVIPVILQERRGARR